MALGVDTATEFFRAMEALSEGFAALERTVNEEYNRGLKEAEAKRDAVLNNPDATGDDIKAALALFAKTEKELAQRAADALAGPRAAMFAGMRLLQAEARKTRARADRLILCDHKLWKEAEKQVRRSWSDGGTVPASALPAVVEAVDTWDELVAFLRHDRFFNEMLVLTQAIDTDLIIARRTKSLDRLSLEISRRKRHTTVDDVVYLRPEGYTRDKAGEESLRQVLGAGLLKSEEFTIKSQDTERCYAARAAAGPGRDSALGYLAHAILAVDVEAQLALERGKDYFIDDSTDGRKFARFVIKMNPTLPPATVAMLRKTSLPRPDVVIHDPAHLEVEEFKSASKTGEEDGRSAVAKVKKWMKEYGLPYRPGRAYKPPARIPVFSTTVAQYPIDFYLKPRRVISGLVVYRYCIDADWKALTWQGVMRVIGLLLIYFLDRKGLPNPSPVGPPIQFPVPLPDPVPLPPRIPVPATLRLTLPASTVRAARGITAAHRSELAQVVDDELIAL